MNRHKQCVCAESITLRVHKHQMLQAHVFHDAGDRTHIQRTSRFNQDNANRCQNRLSHVLEGEE
jgi:hypothetical protein